MEKVSVIIPVYKAEKYLSKCLESVINQTYKELEILCINDCSPDNSADILKEFAKKDCRIRVINNKKNSGSALTRNRGFDEAKGEYIYCIDADDYIDEKYIECMVQKIEEQNCDVVLNLSIFNETNGKSFKYVHPSMPKIAEAGEFVDNITMLHDAPCFIWARMYCRSFLNKHNIRFPDIAATDDVAFNGILNLYAEKTFVFFGENYHYIVNDTGVTGVANSINDRDLKHMQAYDLVYDYMKKHEIYDKRVKLFRVYPFYKVDTEEKFNFYKKFFEKIKPDFAANESIYNDLEKFFASSISESANFEEYVKNYNKVVAIGFLRRKK